MAANTQNKRTDMKTIREITDTVEDTQDWGKIYDILQQWSSDIINECAGSAEYEMVQDDENNNQYEDVYSEQYVRPVLIRSTILEVKEKLLK